MTPLSLKQLCHRREPVPSAPRERQDRAVTVGIHGIVRAPPIPWACRYHAPRSGRTEITALTHARPAACTRARRDALVIGKSL